MADDGGPETVPTARLANGHHTADDDNDAALPSTLPTTADDPSIVTDSVAAAAVSSGRRRSGQEEDGPPQPPQQQQVYESFNVVKNGVEEVGPDSVDAAAAKQRMTLKFSPKSKDSGG